MSTPCLESTRLPARPGRCPVIANPKERDMSLVLCEDACTETPMKEAHRGVREWDVGSQTVQRGIERRLRPISVRLSGAEGQFVMTIFGRSSVRQSGLTAMRNRLRSLRAEAADLEERAEIDRLLQLVDRSIVEDRVAKQIDRSLSRSLTRSFRRVFAWMA